MKRALIILISISLSLVGCNTAPQVPVETVFRYNEPTGISTLDPVYAREQSSIWACHQLFNGLVQMDSELHIQPCIASSWSISENGKKYSFALRQDVFFHNHEAFETGEGRRVVASDVLYSLNRLRDPATASPGAWVLQNVDSIYTSSEDTLVIELKEAFLPFLGMLSMKYCSIVPHEVVSAMGTSFGRAPIGTGPFKFQWWSTDEKLVFRKNPRYFEREGEEQLPYLEAVAIEFITDRQAAFMEFLKGELDLLSGLDASYKDELLTRDGKLQPQYESTLQLQKVPYLNTEYLAINQQLPESNPLSDRRVRLALNLSIDRAKMMRFLRNGIGRPADGGMIPFGLPGYNPTVTGGYELNLDSALHLLELAGFPNGKGMSPITLNTTSNYLDLCEYLQSSWQQLGIPVSVEVLPAPTLREGKANASLDFFRASWIADYPDAENYLSLFYGVNHTPNGPNYTLFSNADFDALYEMSQAETNLDTTVQLYSRMDSLLIDQAPVVPLFYDEVVRFVPMGVEGLTPNALNLLELKRVKKN